MNVSAVSPDRFASVLSRERFAEFQRGIESGRELLAGRVIWNLNSTARGGGVAELLSSLVPYARGAGVDVRWLVIEGEPAFFALTKRLHNRLHGQPGDGGPLAHEERELYERVLAANLSQLTALIRRDDVVIVHDPQPAGLIPALRSAGVAVIWRCHIGIDHANARTREAWKFLRPYIADAGAYLFSRESFAWPGLDRSRTFVVAPSIDVFSAKNQPLGRESVRTVLRACGVLADGRHGNSHVFARHDGTPGRVDRQAELFGTGQLHVSAPLVLQVSRWDRLKDPIGVIRGFAQHVPEQTGAHLLYAGPSAASVADDPEATGILAEARAVREQLAEPVRRRVHLAALPMEDPEENAIIVNALQRHATLVVQKSLAEGFGLTVAEAMWKSRPVVAPRVGGIGDQIVDGDSGVLLDDPRDLRAFGEAIAGLLLEPARARALGQRAHERVRDAFTSPRSLLDHLEVIRAVI